MKARDFVEAIRKVVLDATTSGVISILQRPPGPCAIPSWVYSKFSTDRSRSTHRRPPRTTLSYAMSVATPRMS